MKEINKTLFDFLTITFLVLVSSINTFGQVKYGITGEVGISSTLGTRYTIGFDINHTKNEHSINLSFIPNKEYQDDWGVGLGYQYERELFKNTYLQGGFIFWRGEFYFSYIDRGQIAELCKSEYLAQEYLGISYVLSNKKIHPFSIEPWARFSVIHHLSKKIPDPCTASFTPIYFPSIGLRLKYQIN